VRKELFVLKLEEEMRTRKKIPPAYQYKKSSFKPVGISPP
jgi:hypothetical protein